MPTRRRARLAALAGRALSGLVVLFLLLDGAMELVPIAPVTDMAGQLGWVTGAGNWRVTAASC